MRWSLWPVRLSNDRPDLRTFPIFGMSPAPLWILLTARRDLSPVAEDTVLACLRERYLASSPYTSISASALVSVNPHAYLPINGDASLQDYVAEYYDSTVDDASQRRRDSGSASGSSLSGGARRKLGPHVFRLGLDAFYNMRRTGQDQIILLNGSVGSGKTELRRMMVKAISEVSVANPGKKGGKVGAQIANSQVRHSASSEVVLGC